jgi:conjugative relaxase-like TrwC/TraI family protein
MLSIAKVSTGSAAASYYEDTNDYYHQDHAPSCWQGEGARRLELTGEVDAATFRHLLDGNMLDGSQIHNAAEGRRGGTDFTFSAPKSVSMQALIGGDHRLITAHETAVARAMEYAQGLAAYRVTENGVTQRETSDNLIIAAFRHDLSRAQDPNLHTHAVVINATQRADGEWRALEQREFYHQKMLMGALYRTELALEVQKLGYEIRLTDKDGRFDLAHISPQQIDAFSTRSQAIESVLSANGKTRDQATAREKQVATLATRDKKTEVDHLTLHQSWQDKSRVHGVNYQPNVMLAASSIESRDAAAHMAVSYAIAHKTERQAVVSQADLVCAALEYGTGQTNLAAIQNELVRQTQNGALISAGERYTTEAAQQRERDMLSVAERGRGAMTPIMDKRQVEKVLARSGLNDGQLAAAVLVLSTEERIVAIQGAAGTGKTTMLHEAKELAEAYGYRVQGLAPSAAAARELSNAGISSQTLAAFEAKGHAGLDDKTVLLVDEAGMVSAKDMHQVLHAAEASGARVVLIGDTQQLKAVEAGKPFAQLQEAGIARVEMGEIQRQTDMRLKHAVELAAKGDVAQSLAMLNKHVQQIDSDRDRYAQIAKDYVALAPQDRADTLVVAGTHQARMAINENVRSELGLAGKGMEVLILTRNDLTEAQARMSLSYRPGDLVEAKKPYESLGLQRGDMARVIDGEAGVVNLERADGQRVAWRPAIQTNMLAYRESIRELSLGDQVRFTANNHAEKLINGERATVIAMDVERYEITMQKTDGSTVMLDACRPLHLDHGYCSTVHAAQGQTAERILIEADTKSTTANESAYYVAISRARSEVTIYTDDRDMLPEAMGREDAKAAALDVKNINREMEGMDR